MENSDARVKPPANMPVPRWWWVCNATPGSRPSAKAGHESGEVKTDPALPGADEAIRFDHHIRPLFRPLDRNSMLFAFDLWKEADLIKHGEQILLRLRAGTMPCDGAWPKKKIAFFERWITGRTADTLLATKKWASCTGYIRRAVASCHGQHMSFIAHRVRLYHRA